MRKNFITLSVVSLLAGLVAIGGFWYGKTHTSPALSADNSNDVGVDFTVEASMSHRSSSLSQEMFDDYYAHAQTIAPITERVYSGVIPHHLLAGRYLAGYFEALKSQNPEVIVLIGPNHQQAGVNPVVTSRLSWRTPYGEVLTNQSLVDKLINDHLAVADEKIIDTEHTIGALVPFIKHAWPNAQLVPLILKDNVTSSTVESLVAELKNILPEKNIVLASVDFSHYLPKAVADFHDELSLGVLQSGDLAQVSHLEIDSKPSVAFLLRYNQLEQSEHFNLAFHTNSATLTSKPELAETTSHIGAYFTAGRAASAPNMTMQFFGDIMLDRNVAKNMGKAGLDYLLKNIRGQENRFFEGVSVLAANLEGPFAPARVPTTKSIAFRFDPKLAKQLKQYGFAGFSLANNHSYDMGKANTAFTRKTLNEQGLKYCGDELGEGPEYTWFADVDSNGQNDIAFVCLHNTYHNLDLPKVSEAIHAAKQKASYVIVSIHWGVEYKRISREQERNLAHRFIDLGAAAVIGHHPHVVQEMEVYKDAPIFYSLGNFIFDQYFSQDTQEGLSVGLTFQDGRVKNAYLFPFYGIKSQVQLMSGDRRDKFLEWMEKNSRLGDKKLVDGKIEF